MRANPGILNIFSQKGGQQEWRLGAGFRGRIGIPGLLIDASSGGVDLPQENH
jgi:hypothetical protein